MTTRLETRQLKQIDAIEPGNADDAGDARKMVAIALLLLLVMSIPLFLWWRGSLSSAAFADSEVLESNHLGAATLDLEIGNGTATFRAENMAPGDVVSGQLELVNAGSLPLLFAVTAAGDGDRLAEWLRLSVWRSDATCSADAPGPLLAADIVLTPSLTVLVGNVASPLASAGTQLSVGDSTNVCLGALLLLDAPNAVQGRQTEIDLVVVAVHDFEVEQ
jgi:hypothetical protein